MYCILVTGIPASGKSTMAEYLSQKMKLTLLSKDRIKELLFDRLGFQSREQKVRLGEAAVDLMYYAAEQMMKQTLPFILENNLEITSKVPLEHLIQQYDYLAVNVCLTGDYEVIYQRFAKRDHSISRHPGHIVNDCYPPKEDQSPKNTTPTLEQFITSIKTRGMDTVFVLGKQLIIDTTDFSNVNYDEIYRQIKELIMDE